MNAHCRGTPSSCAKVGYCLHAKMHRQADCADLAKPKRPKPKLSEHQLQRACVQYLRSLPVPPRGPWWTAVNPLPGTSLRRGAQAKALGMVAGAPDIVLVANGEFCGIELKAAGRKASPEQIGTALNIEHAGGNYMIVQTVDEFVAYVRRFLGAQQE